LLFIQDYYYFIIFIVLNYYLDFNNKEVEHRDQEINRIDMIVISIRCVGVFGSLLRRNLKGKRIWAGVV
jgi:hypothetical protein